MTRARDGNPWYARRCAVAAFFAVAVLTSPARGIAGPDTRYRAGVDLVTLDVCVTDRQGRFVAGLTQDDFVIVDGGVARRPALFESGDPVPLASVLLIDRSSSMSGQPLEQARLAATAFMRTIGPGDLVEVLAFGRHVERLSPFGGNLATVGPAMQSMAAGGETALYDALLVARQDLGAAVQRSGREYRQAIIVLSDGEDTGSVLAFEDVLADLRQSGVIVYAVSVRTDVRGRPAPPPWPLAQLAVDTGGRAIAVSTPWALTALYEDVSRELRHLYRLGYEPVNVAADGRWRPLSVRVAQPDARVRTRGGYYAPPLQRNHAGTR